MRFMRGLCLFYDTGKFQEQFCFVMLCGLSSFSFAGKEIYLLSSGCSSLRFVFFRAFSTLGTK